MSLCPVFPLQLRHAGEFPPLWVIRIRSWTGQVLPPGCQHASSITISVLCSGPRTAERVLTTHACHLSEALSQPIKGRGIAMLRKRNVRIEVKVITVRHD